MRRDTSLTRSFRRTVAALVLAAGVAAAAPALAEEATGPHKVVVLPLTGPKGIAARDEIARRLEGRVELVVGSKADAANRPRAARREAATALVGGAVGCPTSKICRVQINVYRPTGRLWERVVERVPRADAVTEAGRIAEELTARLGLLDRAAGVTTVTTIPAIPPPMMVAPPRPSHQAVLAAVDGLAGLTTWAVVPLAHFVRGGRHVVVAWPSMNSRGEVVDATVVGIPLEVTATGEIREAGRRWVIRDRAESVAALASALGGSDHEVVGRDAGAPLDRLGSELARLAAAFASAATARDRSRAVESAAAFAALLPIERAAHEASVAQLLWMAATHGGRLEPVSTTRSGDQATLTIRVVRGGVAFRTIRATARPVSPGVDRWVVVDYQE